MPNYATKTTVSAMRSRNEIEHLLRRYGADGFRYAWCERVGKRVEQIEFSAHNRLIRFMLPMPDRDAAEFALTPSRKSRAASQQTAAWEQACRQRWRALALAVKAKLEAVECGISEFETEFLAFVVEPDTNRTIAEIMRPRIAQRYAGIGGPLDLPGLPSPRDAEDAEFEK